MEFFIILRATEDVSFRHDEKLAAETSEQRAARLEDMSFRQNERLVAETPEQRAARLQCDRDGHRDQLSHFSLIDQPSKMLKFHGHFLGSGLGLEISNLCYYLPLIHKFILISEGSPQMMHSIATSNYSTSKFTQDIDCASRMARAECVRSAHAHVGLLLQIIGHFEAAQEKFRAGLDTQG